MKLFCDSKIVICLPGSYSLKPYLYVSFLFKSLSHAFLRHFSDHTIHTCFDPAKGTALERADFVLQPLKFVSAELVFFFHSFLFLSAVFCLQS